MSLTKEVLKARLDEARATLTKVAAAMGCEPDDDSDLVEAVKENVRERDEAREALFFVGNAARRTRDRIRNETRRAMVERLRSMSRQGHPEALSAAALVEAIADELERDGK